MKDFQWRVALCDDNADDPGIQQTLKQLQQANLSFVLMEKRDDFIQRAGELSRCHLALIDMDWGGVFSEEKHCESIPSLESFDPGSPSDFVAKWISAISSWGHRNAPSHGELGEWPRCQIAPTEMGAWLGALLTNIAPGIEIVFYSGKPGIAARGFAAALGRFRDAAYTVETKTDRSPLPLQSVIRRLTKLQKQALARSDIYDWFLADVLLPGLLGDNLIARNLPEPAIHQRRWNAGAFTFHAHKFFPTLAAIGEEQLQTFYRSAGCRLAEPDGMLELEHNVRRLNFEEEWLDDCDALITELNEVAQRVLVCAPSAVGIARQLWDAVQSIRVQDESAKQACKNIISRVWQLSWATLYEPSCEFHRLAMLFDGRFISELGSEIAYPLDIGEARNRSSAFSQEGDRVLARIDLEGLQRSCVQLKANGAGRLQIIETEKTVVITWIGNWNGAQPSFPEFKKIVAESLQKHLGAHRGLPSVLLFGLVNGAISIRVQLQGQWHLLFGKYINHQDELDRADAFQFEWTFGKE